MIEASALAMRLEPLQRAQRVVNKVDICHVKPLGQLVGLL